MAAIKGAKADTTVLSQKTDLICSWLHKVSSRAGLNVVHVSTLAYSIGQLWAACAPAFGSSKKERSHCHKAMKGCLTQLLHILQPLLPQLNARQASSLLKSLAILRMPQHAVPQTLPAKLIHTITAGDSTAQDIAAALSALAEWQRSVPAIHLSASALQAMFRRFAVVNDPMIHKRYANNQEVLRFLLAAAELRIRPDAATLDALCAHMIALDQQSAEERLSAHSIAMLLQTFSEMRYLPEAHHMQHMLERFATFCTMPPHLQPGLEDIRRLFSAVATLGLTQSSQTVQHIGVQVMNRASANAQTLCTVVRCVAALDVLDLDMFVEFLDVLKTEFGKTVLEADLRQMHQVLYKLEPFEQDSQASHIGWEGARQRLQALGYPQPAAPVPAILRATQAMSQSLRKLNLTHRRHVQFGAYRAEAMLDQKLPRSGPLLLAILRETDTLLNKPDRYAFDTSQYCLLISLEEDSCVSQQHTSCARSFLSARFRTFAGHSCIGV